MNLLHAEWRRLFARRITTIMAVLVLGILAVVAVGVAANSHAPGPAREAAAARQADRVRAEIRQQRARCEQAVASGNTDGEFPPDMDCAQIDDSQIRDTDFTPYTFDFRGQAPGLLRLLGGLLALLGFVVAASFVGAEWSSGGMMNLLVWRPRRLAVLGTKLAAALLGVGLIGVVLSAVWVGVLYVLATLTGDTARITTGSMLSLGLDGLRGVALALAATAVGLALASLGRHTAMALGAAVAWGLVAEVGARMVLGITQASRPERWLLSSYAQAWLTKKARFTDFSSCGAFGGACDPTPWSISYGQGAMVGTAVVVLIVGAALLAIQRRDVS